MCALCVGELYLEKFGLEPINDKFAITEPVLSLISWVKNDHKGRR